MTRFRETPQDEDGTAALAAPRPQRAARPASPTLADDRGAAALEFALILMPLMALVFGIISYGYMLSFRQAISQAAAEGVRAAAVAPAGLDDATREQRAITAVDAALGFGVSCTSTGMTCTVDIAPGCGVARCAEVSVSYAYAANPLIPSFPFVPLPATLAYQTSAAVS